MGGAKLAVAAASLAVVAVAALLAASWLSHAGEQSAVKYVTKRLAGEAYEIEASFPETAKAGSEFEFEFSVRAKEGSEVTGILVTARGIVTVGEAGKGELLRYEKEFDPPVTEYSAELKVKVPEDFPSPTVHVSIMPSVVKFGPKVTISSPTPLEFAVRVTGRPEGKLEVVEPLPALPPSPLNWLEIEVDRSCYKHGDVVTIRLTNTHNLTIIIKPDPPWVICAYSTEWGVGKRVYEPERSSEWVTLEPGASISWTWDLKAGDRYVPPGTYAVALADFEVRTDGRHLVIGRAERPAAVFEVKPSTS